VRFIAQQLLREGFGCGGTTLNSENMKHFGKRQDKERPGLASVFSGTVMAAHPPTADKLTAQDETRKTAMDEAQAKELAWNQSQAAKGDAYGQLRMGQRYRDGEGVATDMVMARSWLSKSAYQGHAQARKELSELPKR